jgi:hypothetical protein
MNRKSTALLAGLIASGGAHEARAHAEQTKYHQESREEGITFEDRMLDLAKDKLKMVDDKDGELLGKAKEKLSVLLDEEADEEIVKYLFIVFIDQLIYEKDLYSIGGSSNDRDKQGSDLTRQAVENAVQVCVATLIEQIKSDFHKDKDKIDWGDSAKLGINILRGIIQMAPSSILEYEGFKFKEKEGKILFAKVGEESKWFTMKEDSLDGFNKIMKQFTGEK